MSDGPDKTIYRTSRPDIVALWDKWQTQGAEFAAKADAFLVEHTPAGAEAMTTDSSWSGMRLTGISATSTPFDPPPVGWRLDRKNWMLVPFRTRKEGKVIAAAMDKVTMPNPRNDLPGMPSWSMYGAGITHCGVTVRDGVMYVIWSGTGPVDNEGNPDKIDLTVWEPVKLSEWYRIKEGETGDGK